MSMLNESAGKPTRMHCPAQRTEGVRRLDKARFILTFIFVNQLRSLRAVFNTLSVIPTQILIPWTNLKETQNESNNTGCKEIGPSAKVGAKWRVARSQDGRTCRASAAGWCGCRGRDTRRKCGAISNPSTEIQNSSQLGCDSGVLILPASFTLLINKVSNYFKVPVLGVHCRLRRDSSHPSDDRGKSVLALKMRNNQCSGIPMGSLDL